MMDSAWSVPVASYTIYFKWANLDGKLGIWIFDLSTDNKMTGSILKCQSTNF